MKSHGSWIVVVLIVVAALGGCATGGQQQMEESSLYDRLGGTHAIHVVVGDFVDLVGSDKRITNSAVIARLGEINIDTLKAHLVDQVCMATGGPCTYTGRDMVTTHVGLGITNQEFDYVADDLVKTLDKYEVGEQEKNELLGLLGPMREDIVEGS